MRIAFDLDATLIPYQKEFETEKRSILQKLLGAEPIRKKRLLEGEKWNFKVIYLSITEENWIEKVKEEIFKLDKNS